MFTIITGGQTGADIAGWKVAKEPEFVDHFKTGGWMPCACLNEQGEHAYDLIYNALSLEDSWWQEPIADQYRERTRRNVFMSNIVLWFGDYNSPGGLLTKRLSTEHKISFWPIEKREQYNLSLQFIVYMKKKEFIMVAGNRESKNPGIEVWTSNFLRTLFREMIKT